MTDIILKVYLDRGQFQCLFSVISNVLRYVLYLSRLYKLRGGDFGI